MIGKRINVDFLQGNLPANMAACKHAIGLFFRINSQK